MKKIQSLERAMLVLNIIDAFGGRHGIGALEIARRAGLKPPTAHNFLQTLLTLGYLEQTERGKYRIGEKTKWLGWDGDKKSILIRAARSHLAQLSEMLGETVLLAARSEYWWQILLINEPRRGLVARSEMPMSDNFYISATGRCLLSRMREIELREYLEQFRLPEPDEWPEAAALEDLQRELAEIRRKRFSVYRNPCGELMGLGTPVPDLPHGAAGAVGVIFPTVRFQKIDQACAVSLLLACAGRIR